MTKFSFVLATNRNDKQFQIALDSCIQQDFQDYEIIVVMNGMTRRDYSEIVTRYSDLNVQFLISEFYSLSMALNLGVIRSSGTYIVRMDADDVSRKTRLSDIDQHIKDDINDLVKVIYSDFDFIDANNVERKNQRSIGNLRHIYYRNVICHPTTVIRRDALLEIGGYFGPLYAEDYDLWIRIFLKHGDAAFSYLDKKCLFYRTLSAGEARASKISYFGAASSQFLAFLRTLNPKWFVGSLFSLLKGVLLGK